MTLKNTNTHTDGEDRVQKRWQNIGVENAFDIRAGLTAHETQFNKLLEHVQIVIGFYNFLCVSIFTVDAVFFAHFDPEMCLVSLSKMLFVCSWFALGFLFQF